MHLLVAQSYPLGVGTKEVADLPLQANPSLESVVWEVQVQQVPGFKHLSLEERRWFELLRQRGYLSTSSRFLVAIVVKLKVILVKVMSFIYPFSYIYIYSYSLQWPW